MITAALLIYLIGLGAAFWLRTWLQIRRTGRSGFNGISGPAGSLSWWAGVLFVIALVLGVAAPVLALTGAVAVPRGAVADVAGGVGLVLLLVGVLATLAAQSGMGASWRIGVDEAERTDLVTTGIFARVRNPIFTAMVIAQLGLALTAPSLVSVAALACLVVAVHLQVRVIEEPYLRRIHGDSYRRYTASTGRFLPRVSR